ASQGSRARTAAGPVRLASAAASLSRCLGDEPWRDRGVTRAVGHRCRPLGNLRVRHGCRARIGLPRSELGGALATRQATEPDVTDPLQAHLLGLLRTALASVAPEVTLESVTIERPKQSEHGDYATNVALQ